MTNDNTENISGVSEVVNLEQSSVETQNRRETDSSQNNVDKIVQERLSREKRKHAKELDEARVKAVSEFRTKHGLSDELLLQAGASHFSDIYKKMTALEVELEDFRRKDQVSREEKIASLALQMAEENGFKLHSDEECRKFAISALKEKLVLDNNGQLCVRDSNQSVKQFLQEWFSQRAFLCKATIPSGGGGSKPSVQEPSRPNSDQPQPNGLFRGKQYSDSEKAQHIALWARQK